MRQLRIDMSKCGAGLHCMHECEDACATRVFKLDGPEHAALHIRILEDGSGQAVLCDQCGDCVVVCPAEALTRNKMGAVIIDKDVCVGCNACVGFCEKGAFERYPDRVVPFKCIACGICAKACPHAALEIVDVPQPAYRIV